MTRWLLGAAALLTLGAIGAWLLSTRPLLYTRLFVSRDERPLVRREILDDPKFGSRLRLISTFQLLIGLGCLAAAFLVP
jgi:hypothetical protein